MAKLINMIGYKTGRLTVVKQSPSKYGQSMWECVCECGNTCTYTGGALRKGKVKSCGCYYKEVRRTIAYASIAKGTHGDSRTRLYYMWASMKNRCSVKSNPSYPNYGGRGISVCDEWKNNFSAFKRWATDNGYDPYAKRGACTIDRIDPDGNYCPENCRWANAVEQSNNRRNTCFITYKGETHSTADWAKITGISRGRIYSRYKAGWPIEKVLSPVKYK
jgi:hypothetical protein